MSWTQLYCAQSSKMQSTACCVSKAHKVSQIVLVERTSWSRVLTIQNWATAALGIVFWRTNERRTSRKAIICRAQTNRSLKFQLNYDLGLQNTLYCEKPMSNEQAVRQKTDSDEPSTEFSIKL